jgi:hypothetical protein
MSFYSLQQRTRFDPGDNVLNRGLLKLVLTKGQFDSELPIHLN